MVEGLGCDSGDIEMIGFELSSNYNVACQNYNIITHFLRTILSSGWFVRDSKIIRE